MINKYISVIFLIITITIIPVSAQEDKEKKVVDINIEADYILTFPELEITVANGNVSVSYKDMEIKCDSFEYDRKLDIFYAQGNITLKRGKEEIKGFSLKYDLKTREGVIYQAEGNIDPVYFITELIDIEENKAVLEKSFATTCKLEKPHYGLHAKELKITPGDKAVAKNISFLIGKTKIFSLPYYVTSLKEEKRKPFSPQIGYTKVDGFFIKTTYSYLLTPRLFGYLYLDWLQKKGTGVGFEQKFHIKEGKASLYLYRFDKQKYQQTSLLSKMDYEQKFSKINAHVKANYTFDNQLTFKLYEVKVHNLNLNIKKQWENGDSNLLVNTRKTYGVTTQSNLNLTSSNRYRFYNTTLSLLLNYKEDKVGRAYPNKELNTTCSLTKSYKRYALSMVFTKRDDIDNEKYPHDNYHIVNKLPEVNISINYHPILFKLFACRYNEYRLLPPPYHYYPINIVKYEIGGDVRKTFRVTKNCNITAGLSAYQNFYSNNDARYYGDTFLDINTTHTKYLNSQIRYNFKDVKGYSPLVFDKIGKFNNILGSLKFGINKKYTLSLSSGYNFETKKYNYLSTKATINPYKGLTIDATWECDINTGQAKDLKTTTVLNRRDISFKNFIIYDTDKGKLKRINYDMKTKLGHFYELEYKTSYDVLLKRFIYNDFLLVRDLHCWLVNISYKEKTKELFFVLYIKAFPTERVKLGIDERGQFYQETFLNF